MSASPAYRQLDAGRIRDTAERLSRRISERFPGSGLAAIAGDLVDLCSESASIARSLVGPILLIRAIAGLAIASLLFFLGFAASQVDWRMRDVEAVEVVQAVESAVNDVVFVAIAVWFLAGWERRVKRSRALRALHSLRSMSHIIDMHQLTKDPERLFHPGPDTASSPERAMTPFELGRYLDYCSEMLSVLGKNAALFAQDFDDPPTLAAVTEIESLTTELSQKIWQKMAVLERAAAQPSRASV